MNDSCRRASAALTVAFAGILLSACASAPVHFYTLVAPGSASATQASTAPSFAFALDPVSVPRQVDIPQLVVMSGSGGLKLAENRRWISPLGEEIRAALSQHLQARLGVADLSRVAAATGTKLIRVKIDVQRFEAAPGAEALVAAAWSVRDADADTVSASCTTQARAAAGSDHDAMVDAYRRALVLLAAQIAAGIEAAAKNAGAVSCPVMAAG